MKPAMRPPIIQGRAASKVPSIGNRSPCRGGGNAKEQKSGLIDRALQGHRFARNGDATLKRLFVQSRIGSLE